MIQVDIRTYVKLEEAFTKRLIADWRKESAPLYEAITKACNAQQWDKARRLVTELDLTEVGQKNKEWVKYLLRSFAVQGANIVAQGKPSFVGTGSFDKLLNQVTANMLQYMEHAGTAQVQQEALQLIAEDEKAYSVVSKFDANQPRDPQGKWTIGGGVATGDLTFADNSGMVMLPNSLGVPRPLMPQITHEHVKAYVDWLKNKGISSREETVAPDTLKPIQKAVNATIAKLLGDKVNIPGRPLIISKDSYVLDGHHRWYQALQKGIPLDSLRINVDMTELLKITHEFPQVEYRSAQDTIDKANARAKEMALKGNPYHEPAGSPEGGQFSSASSSGLTLPEKPGTVAIPDGDVRLYHQTSEENAKAIEKEGILYNKAKGIEGPKAVWASDSGFYGRPGDRPTVEFHIPKKEWTGEGYIFRDIKPSEIIAVHYPWHKHARYMLDSPETLTSVRNGEFDDLMAKGYEEGPAIRYIKGLHSVAKGNPYHDEKGLFASGSGYEPPSHEDQDKAANETKDYLRMIAGARGTPPKGQTYGPETFLLEHGHTYYTDNNSFKGERGTPKQCYMNAAHLALTNPDLTYVEGYVHIGIMPIEHAWVVDKNNHVIDPTLVTPKKEDAIKPSGYFGVPFTEEYLAKTLIKNKVYGLLGHLSSNTRDLYKDDYKTAIQKSEHSYGSTQINIPDDSEMAIELNRLRSFIDNEDLAGQGKDIGGNHITIKYGVKGGWEGIRKYFESQTPFTVVLGEPVIFDASDHSDGASPVVVAIVSPDLHRMNEELEQYGDFKPSNYSSYTPHATLAYVKPDAAWKYKFLPVKDIPLHVAEATISDKNRSHESVRLLGLQLIAKKFDENEVRDSHGRWTTGSGDTSSAGSSDFEKIESQYSRWRTEGDGWLSAQGKYIPNTGVRESGKPSWGSHSQTAVEHKLTDKKLLVPSQDNNDIIVDAVKKGHIRIVLAGRSIPYLHLQLDSSDSGVRARGVHLLEYSPRNARVFIDNLSGDSKTFNDPEEAIKWLKVVKKADTSGRYVTPFVSFDNQGDDKLQLIASLNGSRLSTWGFVAEADIRGLQTYVLTAVLDGRCCPFCSEIANGKVFNVSDARTKVNQLLQAQDPNDLKTLQPWPSQSKAAIAEYSDMSEDELTAAGLHIGPYHPSPVDSTTEFLSKEGWKLVKDAKVGDLAFSLNMESNSVEWVPVGGTVSGPAPLGQMIHFKSQNADLLVTTHHRQIHEVVKYPDGYKYFQVDPAEKLLYKARVTIPRSCDWKGKELPKFFSIGYRTVPTEALVKFLAFWISDGCCVNKGEDSYYITIHTKKYAMEAKKVLERLTQAEVYIRSKRVECYDTDLGKFLLKHVGKLARKIPDFILEADRDTIELFLMSYLQGDGSICITDGTYGKGINKTFFTTNELLAAQLGELIVKVGGFPSYYWQDNNDTYIGERKIESNYPVQRIRWNKSKTATFGPHGSGDLLLIENFIEDTYCLVLHKNSIFYARRNGKCMWTGNCRCLLLPVDKEIRMSKPYVSSEDQVIPAQTITRDTLKELGINATPPEIEHYNAYVGLNPVDMLSKLSGQETSDILNGVLGKNAIQFHKNGDIDFNAKGIMDNVKYAVGTTLDPYTGMYYLNEADLLTGDENAQTAFIQKLFRGLVTTGVSVGAKSLIVAVAAGDATTYMGMGFLPSQEVWDTVRNKDWKELIQSLPLSQQLLVMQALKNSDVVSAGILNDLLLEVDGKRIGELLFQDMSGEFSLDLSDKLSTAVING